MDRKELENKIVIKAWKDPEFKKNLLKNPQETIEDFIREVYDRDISIPSDTKFQILEPEQNTIVIVLPPSPSEMRKTSEFELETIAAGKGAILTPLIGF